MIVSDDYGFVFIHIPKCGGESVRKGLTSIDPGAADHREIGPHPVLGEIDYGHVRLSVLKAHFPEIWDRLQRYETFAVVRDPFDRFASSLSQFLYRSKGVSLYYLDRREMQAELADMARVLSRDPAVEHVRHSHFQRQADFIECDGATVAAHVRPLERIDLLAGDFRTHCGLTLRLDGKVNDSRGKRTHGRDLARYRRERRGPGAALIGGVLRRALPAETRDALRRSLRPSVEAGRVVREDRRIRRFVESFYERDFELYDRYASAD